MCTSIHKPKSSNCFTSDPWAKIITNQNKKSDLQYGAACFTIVNLSKHIIHLLYRVYYTEEENRFSENRRKKETSSRKLIPHASPKMTGSLITSFGLPSTDAIIPVQTGQTLPATYQGCGFTSWTFFLIHVACIFPVNNLPYVLKIIWPHVFVLHRCQ